jgi:hypothetical protein
LASIESTITFRINTGSARRNMALSCASDLH